MKIKAGFIQFAPTFGDHRLNIHKLDPLLDQSRNADLIVLPELSNSGYNFETKEQAIDLAEDISKSLFIEFLIKKAQKHQFHIVAGVNEKENSNLYNTAVLIGPEGLIGKYRKIHLFMNEFDIFEPGDLGLPIFDLGKYKIGILICFDWIFPEAWRILALKGADIICHPSNLVLPYAQQAVPFHGMINRTFNITANRFGTEREVTFSGKSIISDPLGKTLVTAHQEKDEVNIQMLDLAQARNKMITNRNHIFNDRVPDFYKELLK